MKGMIKMALSDATLLKIIKQPEKYAVLYKLNNPDYDNKMISLIVKYIIGHDKDKKIKYKPIDEAEKDKQLGEDIKRFLSDNTYETDEIFKGILENILSRADITQFPSYFLINHFEDRLKMYSDIITEEFYKFLACDSMFTSFTMVGYYNFINLYRCIDLDIAKEKCINFCIKEKKYTDELKLIIESNYEKLKELK